MALATSATLTQEFVDMLSAELLPREDDRYPFYENGPIMKQDDEATQPGKVILFDRPVLPTGTFTEASRRLTEGTAIGTDSLAVTMDQVSLTVREYAGPHDGSAIKPFGITEFLKKRAKHDLVGLIGSHMRRDRIKFLDQTIMDLLLAATTVVTPNGVTEAAIAAGQVATASWLRALNKTMKDALIPTFPNGNWRLIINTRDEQNLLADTEYREANRYLGLQNPVFKGHIGTFAGFDIMSSTRFPTKAVGAASAVTGYQGVAFGPYGVGHGVGMEPQIRAANDTDFGRQERVLWVAHECFGTLMANMLVRTITT